MSFTSITSFKVTLEFAPTGFWVLTTDDGSVFSYSSSVVAIQQLNLLVDRLSDSRSMKRADKTQVGGGHYKVMAIQVAEFCQRNRIPFCESMAIKYLCRHSRKGGVQDLEKAKHLIDLLIQYDYSSPSTQTSTPTPT